MSVMRIHCNRSHLFKLLHAAATAVAVAVVCVVNGVVAAAAAAVLNFTPTMSARHNE